MVEVMPVVTESVNRLEFSDVYLHDALDITTGQGEEAWKYGFIVDRTGKWPHGQIRATTPSGETTEPFGFELHGCGLWTTKKQNPVQQNWHGTMFTPYYDGLIAGEFMWGKFDGQEDRSVFDKPGQQISEIIHTPYRENAVLQTLGHAAGALSVRQITELLPMKDPAFRDKDIRVTLNKLVASGMVAFIQKKTQLFELVPANS